MTFQTEQHQYSAFYGTYFMKIFVKIRIYTQKTTKDVVIGHYKIKTPTFVCMKRSGIVIQSAVRGFLVKKCDQIEKQHKRS